MSNEKMTVNYNDEGIEALAMAVAYQAALDYQEEFHKSKELGYATRELLDLEEFFASDYGNLITLNQGDLIRYNIHKGVKVEPKYNTNALTEEDCKYIKEHYKGGKGPNNCTLEVLATKFKVSTGTIHNVLVGRYTCAG